MKCQHLLRDAEFSSSYSPNDQCMMLQNHTWEKDPFKVQKRPVGFNITKYKKFNDMISDSLMQLLKKLPLKF